MLEFKIAVKALHVQGVAWGSFSVAKCVQRWGASPLARWFVCCFPLMQL